MRRFRPLVGTYTSHFPPLSAYLAWGVYALIIGLYGFSLWALFSHRSEASLWQWSETWQILKYSGWQALLSALLSILCGVAVARAFFYLRFRGKTVLYKLLVFCWSLPSLVVIFAMIGVWGNAGWLAAGWRFFGIEWQFPLYGLSGILLAHLFFNIPLVVKYYLEGLRLIPHAQHKLAAQLGLRGWLHWRVVELPMLRKLLPYLFANVFLVCFTSFPVVLMLGGGPKYSTLEVAIYQAVSFEFDFAKAVMLILVQLGIGIVLQLLMDLTTRMAFQRHHATPQTDSPWLPEPQGLRRRLYQLYLLVCGAFILLPLANVLYHALSVPSIGVKLANPTLWHATFYSVIVGVISAVSVIALAMLLGLEARRLAYQGHTLRQQILAGASTYPLILPIFLLAVGLFLLLMEVELSTFGLLLLVGLCNGLSLLPFVYRLIYPAMWKAWVDYDKLAQLLGLSGLRRWWIVEKHALIRPLASAFALAFSAGLGSFSVIAFFGSPDFLTLPYLLYQQLGSYRSDDAALTAFILLLCALLPFLFIEQREIK